MATRRGGRQTRVCRCDVGDAGQLATVLDDLAANGGIAGAIHAAGVLADAPLQGLMTTSWLPFSR